MSKVPTELLEAYRAAQFRVDDEPEPFHFQIGQVSQALVHLFERHGVDRAAYLTAWNPLGTPQSRAANDRAQAALAVDLRERGLTCLQGAGEDPWLEWIPEESLLVLGLSRDDAAALGRRYRQNAIVWCGPDGIPELLVLR